MSTETQHAIEQVLDLWNIQRLTAASCLDIEVTRAMVHLREALYREQEADDRPLWESMMSRNPS